MKKSALALTFLVAIAFSGITYANFQDKPATTKTETVKNEDEKKSDVTKKECTKDNKECPKKTEKECSKK